MPREKSGRDGDQPRLPRRFLAPPQLLFWAPLPTAAASAVSGKVPESHQNGGTLASRSATVVTPPIVVKS